MQIHRIRLLRSRIGKHRPDHPRNAKSPKQEPTRKIGSANDSSI